MLARTGNFQSEGNMKTTLRRLLFLCALGFAVTTLAQSSSQMSQDQPHKTKANNYDTNTKKGTKRKPNDAMTKDSSSKSGASKGSADKAGANKQDMSKDKSTGGSNDMKQ
jgi:hypothetical protein